VTRLEAIKLKADWADKHIRDLGNALRAFHQKQPNFIGSEMNPETGEKRFYVTAIPEIPPEIRLITGDVITGDPGVLSLVTQTNFAVPTEPLKIGDPIFFKPANLNQKMEFKFEVAINEPQIIEFKPIFETLHVMFKFVDNIIPRFADLL